MRRKELSPRRPLFIMMCGLPCSGKSEVAKELAAHHNCTILSSESIRKELFGEDYHHRKRDNYKVFTILHQRILQYLSEGKNVIYSATNIRMKTRIKFLNKLEQVDCTKVCYYVARPFDQCMAANIERDIPVKIDDLVDMYYSFEIPYYYEGWDNIRIAWTGRPDQSTRALFKDEVTGLYNYKNTHINNQGDQYNIGEMLQRAHDIAESQKQPRDVITAALFAEIGYPNIDKYLTKGHKVNRMSAQDSVFYSCISYIGPLRFIADNAKMQRFCLDVAILIQWRELFEQYDKADVKKLSYIMESDTLQKIVVLNDICEMAKKQCRNK